MMRRIFEDILDDIDLDNDENIISKLSQNDDFEHSAFDYQIVIWHYPNSDNAEIENEVFVKNAEKLKRKLDVYLDSFRLDILEIDNDAWTFFENYGVLIDETDLKNKYCRIYLNFDGNLMHMLKCFNEIVFQADLYKMLIDQKTKKELKLKLNILDDNYPLDFFNKYKNNPLTYKNVEKIKVIRLADVLIDLFWNKRQVLKLGEFKNLSQQKTFVIDAIKKFIKNNNGNIYNYENI